MKSELALLTSKERQRRSEALCGKILASSHWAAAKVVLLFSPLPDEPDISGLYTSASSKRFVYPRVAGQTIALHAIDDPALLVPMRWNIREPADDPATRIDPQVVELALIPGLAFSRGMDRLGRGAGFYDRFLPQLAPTATKLGVCLNLQLVDSLPSEEHDISMDSVVTECGLSGG